MRLLLCRYQWPNFSTRLCSGRAYLSESESSFIEVENTTTDKDAVEVYK